LQTLTLWISTFNIAKNKNLLLLNFFNIHCCML
jgi:hypothetical protein